MQKEECNKEISGIESKQLKKFNVAKVNKINKHLARLERKRKEKTQRRRIITNLKGSERQKTALNELDEF